MTFSQRLNILLKSLGQLGLQPMALYAWYQVALRTGSLRRATSHPQSGVVGEEWSRSLNTEMISIPPREELLELQGESLAVLISDADEIVNGRVRCFGGPPVPLALAPSPPLAHWTSYELGEVRPETGDIKLIWEPARFGWAVTLAQAHWLTGNEAYAQAFWQYTDLFLQANPPFAGPNWVSAQEAALRLICLAFSVQVFAGSVTFEADRQERLAQAIGEHASRILPSLAYARSQNNNHLLAEAAGLYTAGRVLPGHPRSDGWCATGRRWFNQALEAQIAWDGTYVQHSANYHRLMLQLALWMFCIGFPFSPHALRKLIEATNWLHALVHPASGAVPNLGPNDGAYILPLTCCPFSDFRPVLQAASLAFRDRPAFAAGPWTDMSLWLANQAKKSSVAEDLPAPPNVASPQSLMAPSRTPHILRSPDHPSWAYLRAARFAGRPGHADQLHLDLWVGGINVAVDAGTFSYNDPPPWDNALARTAVHNTLTVEGADQMAHAGRFLWLDWAQAHVLEIEAAADGSFERILAEQDGYRRFGILHRREVVAEAGGRWLITDQLLAASAGKFRPRQGGSRAITARLHWLLPDWPWQILANRSGSAELELMAPLGPIRLGLRGGASGDSVQTELSIVRAGQQVHGRGQPDPTWGWLSPTYHLRLPAVSLGFCLLGKLPISLVSEWAFPGGRTAP